MVQSSEEILFNHGENELSVKIIFDIRMKHINITNTQNSKQSCILRLAINFSRIIETKRKFSNNTKTRRLKLSTIDQYVFLTEGNINLNINQTIEGRSERKAT